MFLRLFCLFGWHTWDEPYHMEPIRLSGIHILFMTYGTQKGKRRCHGCKKEQNCERSGFCGLRGSGGSWAKSND